MNFSARRRPRLPFEDALRASSFGRREAVRAQNVSCASTLASGPTLRQLQRAAGNKAVAELLASMMGAGTARHPFGASVQRMRVTTSAKTPRTIRIEQVTFRSPEPTDLVAWITISDKRYTVRWSGIAKPRTLSAQTELEVALDKRSSTATLRLPEGQRRSYQGSPEQDAERRALEEKQLTEAVIASNVRGAAVEFDANGSHLHHSAAGDRTSDFVGRMNRAEVEGFVCTKLSESKGPDFSCNDEGDYYGCSIPLSLHEHIGFRYLKRTRTVLVKHVGPGARSAKFQYE